MSDTKNRIRELLEAGDYEGLLLLGKTDKTLLRRLIALTYDKTALVCWRAIRAFGLLSRQMRQTDAKAAIDRLMTMMRDESGGNPWSAPEMIGEVIKHNPRTFSHMVPILVSFRDEEMFTAGILSALAQLAVTAPDLVLPYRELAFLYLHSGSAELRGNALLVMRNLKDGTYAGEIRKMVDDSAGFSYFDGEGIVETSVGKLAAETLQSFSNN
ncbi:MAG: hypothetical protein M0Z59_05640 [Nitrospiraceae bacterium]|nr:hypothetical protein [Nitrospiraceae bacterium]